jgi:DNA ligase-1
MVTTFETLALLGEQLEQTSSRLEMQREIARFLRELSAEEIPPGLRLLIGQVFPEWDDRTLNLSWRTLFKVAASLTKASESDWQQAFSEAVDGGEAVRLVLDRFREEPTREPPLTILHVYECFEVIAETTGKGSRARKEQLLADLMSRASAIEAKYLVKNVLREMRHGVSEGIVLDAIAEAFVVKKHLARRANMLLGDLGEVAVTALERGEAGLQEIRPRPFRPIKPMLAQPAKDLADALENHGGEVALEYKLDGARVQIHKDGSTIRVYTRNLSEVTDSLPEIVQEVREQVRAQSAIVEGEVIAVDEEGRPLPFQHLMRRFRRVHKVSEASQRIPVQLHLFDILFLEGENLVDSPYEQRWLMLEQTKGGLLSTGRSVPATLEEAKAFTDLAYEEGHEGVMVKHLHSPYRPGVRGKSWLKVKRTVALDLVIVAADWGYGRRHGWLSNYHLAARDEVEGTFFEVGKTFKGLTDEEFKQMTERLLTLETHRQRGTVFVQPQVVVEVLFNEIQASPQYESGLALRFARISRLRDDKRPEEADTLQAMRRLFEEQYQHKGEYGGAELH